MGFSTVPCNEFVEVLASKAPVPGGGGASALVGAIGTALGNMVGSLTVGKKKYADVEAEMYELKAKADKLQAELLHLIERDAEVFEPLSKAYGMPRETEEEKAEKARVMEIVLKDACSVPIEIMEKCCEAIEIIVEFAAKGSALAISDAGVGVAFCKAALKGASLNVYINTKSMKNREYAEELNAKCDAMLEKYTKIADEVFDSVLGRLKLGRKEEEEMAKQLLGKEVTAALNERIKADVAKLEEKGVKPTLCIIRVGENDSDISYERGATKRCETLGVACEKILLPADVSQEELLATIDKVNKDDAIHGVLLFRPLPKHLDQSVIENALDPAKDVDCMTDGSMSGVFTGKNVGFPPCTPQACMEILDHYGIDCTGKKAVVVGRSLVVGKPAAMMLIKKNATVTVCHTRTVDMPSVVREADIVIVAAGRAGIVDDTYLAPGQVVIDVGINVNAEGKLCGDVDYAKAEPVVEAITPVPGGVGSVTTSVLVGHVVEAAKRKYL